MLISEHDSVRKINLLLGYFPHLLSFPFIIILALSASSVRMTESDYVCLFVVGLERSSNWPLLQV